MCKTNSLWLLSLSLLLIFASCGDDESPEALVPEVISSAATVNFGEIDAETSSIMSFTLSAKDLTDDVTVSVTGDGFSISDSETGTYGTSLTFEADNISSAVVTIYLKFEPQGVGPFDGTILIESELADKTISVSGSVPVPVSRNLIFEDFMDYETLQSAGSQGDLKANTEDTEGWYSWNGSPALTLTDALSFNGYPFPNKGKGFDLGAIDGAVAARRFAETVQAGVHYYSCLIKITETPTETQSVVVIVDIENSKWAVHLRVGAASAGKFTMGPMKQSGQPDYVASPVEYDLNTTYAVVMKYTFDGKLDGDLDNQQDVIDFYVFEGIPDTEPATPDVSHSGGQDFRPQAWGLRTPEAGGNGIQGTIDGLQVAKTWAELFSE